MGTYNKTLFLPVVHHTNLKTTPESLEDTLTANNLQLPTHLSTTMSFTANSRAPQIHPSNAPQEPTGQVASDSLAAESLKNQGGFAENAHAAASSVSGSSSTLNNTDTSGAKVLQPAEDGTAREKQNALGPGYTSTVTGAAAPPGTYKPKGANLEDADATESMPKPKVFIGDVGGSHDPGRLAEQNFEARNTGPAQQVSSSGNEGGAQRQAGSGGREAVGEQGGSFGVLDSERA